MYIYRIYIYIGNKIIGCPVCIYTLCVALCVLHLCNFAIHNTHKTKRKGKWLFYGVMLSMCV